MNFSSFDKIILRLGGIAVLAVFGIALFGGLLLTFGLSWEGRRSRQNQQIVQIDTKSNKKEFFRLGHFQALKKTDLLLIPLNSSKKEEFSLSSYKSSYHNTRNYLVFNTKTKVSQWVWSDNDRLLISDSQIHLGNESEGKVVGLLFEFAGNDTNQNGELDSSDEKNLEYFDLKDLSRLSLLSGVSQVFGVRQLSANEIGIFFLKNNKSYVGIYDMATKAMPEPKEISLPN